MKKVLKWVGIVVGVLAVVLFIAFKFMQANTKKASPEATVNYKKDCLLYTSSIKIIATVNF